jgi:competence ComEA-like helix-hairpin-helix protein
MKLIAILILFSLSISLVFADCSQDQIDINSASLSELDKLSGIGEVKAQAIADSRPHNSVDDLIKVYGIGEATLEKIKQQGLACVYTRETGKSENTAEEQIPEETKNEEQPPSPNELNILNKEYKTESIINLNNEEIKEEKKLTRTELVNKNLIYAFCIFLFGLIFLILKD